MRKHMMATVSAAFLLGAAGVQAANLTSDQPLLCAVQNVSECLAGTDCERVFPEEINLPDFFMIDPANRMVVATGQGGDERKTPIEYSERLDGKLILLGADDGVPDVRDGIAWSMSVDETTGKMIISASGDGFVLAVFGACTPR